MKFVFAFFFSFFFLFLNAEKVADSTVDKAPSPSNEKTVAAIQLPENYEDLVKKAPVNTMEKRINMIVGEAVREDKVVIRHVNDFLFVQVVPNYAYPGEKGEERLAEDLMAILNSGEISAPRGAQFMNISYSEMVEMNLPFEKKLIDSMIIGAEKFEDLIDLTFFVNVNAVTNLIYNSLENVKEFEAVYNSAEKYYRTRYENSRFLYLIRVPNLIYEVVYTGDLYEVVISRQIKESLFIAGVLKKYEQKISEDEKLSFHGRYIRGENIFVDLWFLPENTKFNREKADKIMQKVIKGKKVEVSGSQKG